MKTILISALFLFFFTGVLGQYPFEKYPAVKYKKVPFKVTYFEKDSSRVATAKYQRYNFFIHELFEKKGREYSCQLSIKVANKVIFKVEVDPDIFWVDENYPLKIADINGDGLVDFKITYPNAGGNGLAGSRVWKVYLFNKGHDRFEKIAFGDFYSEEKDEHDLDGDGNFEIIAQHYVSHNWHAYWCFDLYNYVNGKLVNVSYKNNYPIMVRAFQDKESYQVTKKMSGATMRSYSKKAAGLLSTRSLGMLASPIYSLISPHGK